MFDTYVWSMLFSVVDWIKSHYLWLIFDWQQMIKGENLLKYNFWNHNLIFSVSWKQRMIFLFMIYSISLQFHYNDEYVFDLFGYSIIILIWAQLKEVYLAFQSYCPLYLVLFTVLLTLKLNDPNQESTIFNDYLLLWLCIYNST